MHASTFNAFQDELVKIAAAIRTMSPEDADKFFGSHAQRVANVEEMAKKFHQERGIPEHVPQGPGTVVARHPKPGPPVPTGVHATPQASPEMTRTFVRPASVPGHAPASVPHPTSVPGGAAKVVGRGMGQRLGTMMRANAAPLAIGAGATALGAMALSKMRQRNATSR